LVRRAALSGSQICHCADALVVPVAQHAFEVGDAWALGLLSCCVNGRADNVRLHALLIEPELELLERNRRQQADDLVVMLDHPFQIVRGRSERVRWRAILARSLSLTLSLWLGMVGYGTVGCQRLSAGRPAVVHRSSGGL